MKIYTKGGDKGKTSLLSGERVEKNNLHIDAYGTIDELNSFIGILISELESDRYRKFLLQQQHILFAVGSHLALQTEVSFDLPEIYPVSVGKLENEIDILNKKLPTLKKFIIPGGSKSASAAHACRSICRRAERLAVKLSLSATINKQIIPYLNRLSDYLFVLARSLNIENNTKEVFWEK